MKRREFITLLGGAAVAWPLGTEAQQSQRMRRVGVLMATAADDQESMAWYTAFLQGLQELGGPTAAMCGSTYVGLRAMQNARANTPEN